MEFLLQSSGWCDNTETVKIKIVISLVTTSGNIDFDFTKKSQYFIGKYIKKVAYCTLMKLDIVKN